MDAAAPHSTAFLDRQLSGAQPHKGSPLLRRAAELLAPLWTCSNRIQLGPAYVSMTFDI